MFNNCFSKSKTHFIFKKQFFEHRAVYEMMRKNMGYAYCILDT